MEVSCSRLLNGATDASVWASLPCRAKTRHAIVRYNPAKKVVTWRKEGESIFFQVTCISSPLQPLLLIRGNCIAIGKIAGIPILVPMYLL